MYQTALSICQAATRELNTGNVPTTLESLTEPGDLQILNLLYEVCQELRKARAFPQMKRNHVFLTKPNRRTYQLPPDFYSALPLAAWNVDENNRLHGPVSDADMTLRLYGQVSSSINFSYRIFGPDQNASSTGGQFFIDDISISPDRWEAKTAYSVDDYVSTEAGYVYRCSVAGTSGESEIGGAGTVTDGSCTFLYVDDWAATTAYTTADSVIASGNIYRCTSNGTSGSTEISGTGSSISDGTATWSYVQALPDADVELRFDYLSRTMFLPQNWQASTGYSNGDQVNVNGNIYTASAGTSGSVAPSGRGSSISDGGTTWAYSDDPKETVTADEDLCIFDYDLVKNGLKAALTQAWGGDPAYYRKKFVTDISVAKARFNGATVNTFGHGNRLPRYRLPYRGWNI